METVGWVNAMCANFRLPTLGHEHRGHLPYSIFPTPDSCVSNGGDLHVDSPPSSSHLAIPTTITPIDIGALGAILKYLVNVGIGEITAEQRQRAKSLGSLNIIQQYLTSS